jgi:fibronectin type 3 domain-containing protein
LDHETEDIRLRLGFRVSVIGIQFRLFRIYNMTRIVLLMTVLLMTVGCGVKKPPVSWESVVPLRIVNLEALPREGHLLLEWSVPKRNTDKSPLTDLAEFKILRSEGVLIAGECRGCGEKKEVISEIKVGPEEVKGGRMSVRVENQDARKVYVYQVVSINRRGYPGAPSNPISVYWDYPPQVPRMVKGESGDKKVDLSWETVEGATGYNIYRREEGGVFPLKPLSREPLVESHYTDLNVENDRKYTYSVRAVKRVVKTDVEGKGSLDVTLTPTKRIPPGPPVGLVAIPLKNGIELNWRRNPEPDLLGYYVYRRKPGEKEFKRLNESPLEKEIYLDIDVELGQEYDYAVTAVDNSARRNESPFSEEVRVKYLF